MSLVIFLLATYGTTNILTAGKIFARAREWLGKRSAVAGYWIRCPMCIGFPVGIFWSVSGLWPATGISPALDLLAAGASSSGWCWTMRVVLHRLGEDAL